MRRMPDSAAATIGRQKSHRRKSYPLWIRHARSTGPGALQKWRKFARNLVSIEPLATGHYIQEEMPEQCLERFFRFFVA